MLRDDDPRGTVEELEALRVNMAKYGSCARKVVEDGELVLRGCKEWKRCELPEKTGKGPKTSGLNGRGPCNKGLQLIKKSATGEVKVVRVALSCFHIPGFKKRHEMNDGLVTVTASEGETIQVRGSVVRDEVVPGEGMKRFVDDKVIPQVVPAFPRPGSHGNLAEQQLVVEETQRILSERRAGAPARLLGVSEENDGREEGAPRKQ